MSSEALKVLFQQRPAGTSDVLAYTVPASTEAICLVRVTNTTASSATFRVAITTDGAVPAAADGDFIAYDVVCVPGDVIDIGGISLDAADRIYIRTGTADSLSFAVMGVEVTD